MRAEEPLVWHYGLMAERWAEFNKDAPELPFFRKAIARFGQPVLDLACGVGRLLLPLLREGIDIDGCDISPDMLYHCRKKAAAEGLTPRLYQQAMHELHLERTYKTVYICGSFGLAGSREKELETLRRCYAHLAPGGALLLNSEAQYTSRDSWDKWLTENVRNMPQPWPDKGAGQIAADGSEHFAQFRFVSVDPLEQSCTRQVRLEKWSKGEMVASEEHTLRNNVYLKPELLLMLQVAGFQEITVQGDYTEEPARADHEELVFTAIR